MKYMTMREAIEEIEDISIEAQSTNPKRAWLASHTAVCAIYRIAHAARAPKCRRNHPKWGSK